MENLDRQDTWKGYRHEPELFERYHEHRHFCARQVATQRGVFIMRVFGHLMGAMLRWAGILALVAIAAAVLFGLELGIWFSLGMVGLAGGAILCDTSKILRHWPNDRYVGAALELFSSFALMFWYVLRLFMGRR